MICQLCNKPVGSHWTSHPIIGAICSVCRDLDKTDKLMVEVGKGPNWSRVHTSESGEWTL